MKDQIIRKLEEIEREYQVTILFACESGSRAWGFASPDSDYDVRFIYAHPESWYLSIEEEKDTLDFPLDDNQLDCGGWEIRKTLRLFRKSNAVVYEWLQSPIVYLNRLKFQQELWALRDEYFSFRSAIHHYVGIAHNALQMGVQDYQINIKKYFYVLRPLLAAKWILERSEVPPMVFDQLRDVVQDLSINTIIDNLLQQKAKAKEGELINVVPELQHFIAQELERCQIAAKTYENRPASTESLNVLFRSVLKQLST